MPYLVGLHMYILGWQMFRSNFTYTEEVLADAWWKFSQNICCENCLKFSYQLLTHVSCMVNLWRLLVSWKVIHRAVASLTVPGGQEIYFPHFFFKFQSIFSSHVLPYFGTPGGRLFTGKVMTSSNSNWFTLLLLPLLHWFCVVISLIMVQVW